MACLPVCLLPLPPQLDWQLYEGDYHVYLLQDYIPVPGIQRSSLNKYQCLYLSNERINILNENFLAVQWLGLSLHYWGQGVPPVVREPRSHNLWGAAKKKKKKVKKPKNILKGSWDACLLSQEERFTVNVSKNSNETWCLSIPLPCKVLSAGIPFLLLVVITTALLSQSTQHHLSSILWRGTKFLVYCWGVPSLVCAPRPSGGRASPQATTGPSRRRSAVSCCKSAKSNCSSGEARSCRNLWLAANKGRAAGAPPREAWVGWSCRQSAGTDFPPLYLVYCGRKILKNFQQIEPVAVLTACFRDWKHRRRQSYLQKTPLPPSIS